MKRTFTFLLLASLMIVATNKVSAQTNVPALILSDQVWDINGSPYLINQNTYIDTNASVRIMPGVEVLFQSNTTLQVDGELQALGTEDSTILFDQLKIQLRQSAKSYDSTDGSGIHFKHCVFKTPGIAKQMIQINSIGARIENSLFIDGYYCIYAMATSMTSPTLEVINCTFNDSTGTSYPIYVSSANFDLVITGNTFNNFAKGGGIIIYANDLYMTNNTANGQNYIRLTPKSALINCNEFKNLRSGVEININTKDTINGCVFTHNTLDSCGSSSFAAGMLRIYKSSIYNLNDSRFNNNNFLTNTGSNEKVIIAATNPSPTSYEMVDLKNNYWASTDSATIESYIKDYADDINIFGRADFSGFLSNQDTTCEGVGNPGTCQASFYLAVDTNNLFNLYVINNSTGTSSATNYYWTFGDGSGSNNQNPTHYYTNFGQYQLCLTIYDSSANCYSTYCDSIGLDSNGNLLKKTGFSIMVLDESDLSGIRDQHLFLNARIYPNPSNGMLNIEIPEPGYQSLDIRVMDFMGREVYETHLDGLNNRTNTVNLSTLQEGMYLLHLQSGNEKFTTRIMISR